MAPKGPSSTARAATLRRSTALRFDRARGLRTALGDATEVRRTDERKAILDALRKSCDPLPPTAITTLTGTKGPNVRKLLEKMVKAGEIFKAGRGTHNVATQMAEPIKTSIANARENAASGRDSP
jgi:hypothetical protein